MSYILDGWNSLPLMPGYHEVILDLNDLQEFDYENIDSNLLWMSDDMYNSRTKAGYLGHCC